MKPMEPDQPGFPTDPAATREQQRLQRENQELRQQLEELKNTGHSAEGGVPQKLWQPSGITIWSIFLVAMTLIA